MGDQDQRGAALLVEFEEQVADALAGLAVEVAGGLVGEQHVGFGGKGAGDGHPLLFAAGQLARRMAEARAEADPLQQAGGTLAGIAAALQFERQHDVLQRIEVVEQLEGLEHEADVLGAHLGALVLVEVAEVVADQRDRAVAGQVEAGEQTEQGRLAGTGSADDGQAVAAAQVEGQVVEDGQVAFRAGNHFAKVPRSQNALAHGESNA
ncbi:hypothetical protein D9M69_336600 [compost metagenome]